MNELFEKEGQSIFTFKKGDYIIKVKDKILTEEVYNSNLGISIELYKGIDTSFRRNPLEFIGIYNNIIYLRDIIQSSFDDKKRIHKTLLSEHTNDWALFEIPEGLKLEDCISFF